MGLKSTWIFLVAVKDLPSEIYCYCWFYEAESFFRSWKSLS